VIVLDTNVLSEAISPVPSAAVLGWLAAQESHDLFTTVVTQAELLYGVELLPAGKRRARLLDAVEKFFAVDLQTEILPFDEECARAFANLMASRVRLGRPMSQFDGMNAAIAVIHRAAVATRDTAGFEGCGIQVINPWSK